MENIKRPRTYKQILNHPLVTDVWEEEFDDGDHYCVQVKAPYWFVNEESIWMHYRTIKEVYENFYPEINPDYK